MSKFRLKKGSKDDLSINIDYCLKPVVKYLGTPPNDKHCSGIVVCGIDAIGVSTNEFPKLANKFLQENKQLIANFIVSRYYVIYLPLRFQSEDYLKVLPFSRQRLGGPTKELVLNVNCSNIAKNKISSYCCHIKDDFIHEHPVLIKTLKHFGYDFEVKPSLKNCNISIN